MAFLPPENINHTQNVTLSFLLFFIFQNYYFYWLLLYVYRCVFCAAHVEVRGHLRGASCLLWPLYEVCGLNSGPHTWGISALHKET